jgi:hypothetical protein
LITSSGRLAAASFELSWTSALPATGLTSDKSMLAPPLRLLSRTALVTSSSYQAAVVPLTTARDSSIGMVCGLFALLVVA